MTDYPQFRKVGHLNKAETGLFLGLNRRDCVLSPHQFGPGTVAWPVVCPLTMCTLRKRKSRVQRLRLAHSFLELFFSPLPLIEEKVVSY